MYWSESKQTAQLITFFLIYLNLKNCLDTGDRKAYAKKKKKKEEEEKSHNKNEQMLLYPKVLKTLSLP